MHVIASFLMALAAQVAGLPTETVFALGAATIIHAVVWIFCTW